MKKDSPIKDLSRLLVESFVMGRWDSAVRERLHQCALPKVASKRICAIGVEAKGGECLKWASPGRRGVPDRIIMAVRYMRIRG